MKENLRIRHFVDLCFSWVAIMTARINTINLMSEMMNSFCTLTQNQIFIAFRTNICIFFIRNSWINILSINFIDGSKR